MTGFVYKWTNQINGKWYIGSRKGTTNDGYRHSSKIMKLAEEKYGIENFIREILFEGDYEKDQIRSVKEAEYLQEKDAANNSMSYNQNNITGPDCWSKESNRKRSRSLKGIKRGPLSKEHKEKLSKAKIGIKRPDISARLMGRKRPDIAAKLKGKKRPDVAAALKGRIRPEKMKALIINGTIYESRIAAAKSLNVSGTTIRRWLKNGRNQTRNINP